MRHTHGLLASAYRRLVIRQIGSDFRACTAIESAVLDSQALRPMEVLIRNRWAGVNASDVNFIAGKYGQGVSVGSGCGLEAVGEVIAVGSDAAPVRDGDVKIGDAVVTQFSTGGFADLQVAHRRTVRKVPRCDPVMLSLEVSGLTASIALQQVAQPIAGETALVTAAAGGTGSYAVQLLKHVYRCGCVVGTCGDDAKVDYLRRLGCDHVINHKKEPIGDGCRRLVKGGFGVVYESVGGEALRAAIENVAIRGRIVTLGAVSSYLVKDAPWTPTDCDVSRLLLSRSASLRGFFLPHFRRHQQPHFHDMLRLIDAGTIAPCVDTTRKFCGLEAVPDAVDHLLSGKNQGKVVVELP